MSFEFTRSVQLFDKAQRIIPGGVNSPVRAFRSVGGTPVYIDRASGSRFIDADGNEFVDFCQSWGPLILGHSHPKVVEAVRDAAGRGLSYGACHAKEVELAERVLRAFPDFERVRLVSSGTEAVMTALRIARGATGRNLILKFEGCYHGHTDAMLVKAGSGLATHGISSSKGIPEEIARSTLVAPLDDEAAVEGLFARYGDDIAAVIIEPLPANNGLLVQRREFLAYLRDITARRGAMLIFDEVISGFRFRFGGYGAQVGLVPDMVTLGKIIGGGMPVGAIVGRATQMDRLAPLGDIYQAGTLSGNPVSLAAGCATLDILENDPPYDAIDRMGALFVETLAKNGSAHARAIRLGSVIWPYFDEGDAPRRASAISPRAVERFNKAYWPLLRRGWYLPPSAYEVLFLSAAHTEAEVVGLAKAMEEAMSDE